MSNISLTKLALISALIVTATAARAELPATPTLTNDPTSPGTVLVGCPADEQFFASPSIGHPNQVKIKCGPHGSVTGPMSTKAPTTMGDVYKGIVWKDGTHPTPAANTPTGGK